MSEHFLIRCWIRSISRLTVKGTACSSAACDSASCIAASMKHRLAAQTFSLSAYDNPLDKLRKTSRAILRLSSSLFAMDAAFETSAPSFAVSAFVSRLEEHVDVDGELDGIASRSRSEIVLPSLEAGLPRVEVHGRHLIKLRVLLVKIQTL